MEFLYLLLIIFILLSIPVFLYFLDIEHPLRVKVFTALETLSNKTSSMKKSITTLFQQVAVTTGLGKVFGLVVVPSEKAWIVDRFGIDRVLTEGIQSFNFVVDKKEKEVDLKEFKVDPQNQEILTKDNINIVVDMRATARIIEPLKAVKAVENYEEKLSELLEDSTYEKLAALKFTQIQLEAQNLRQEIKELMEERCKVDWGIEMMQVTFENIKPPKEVTDAMEREIIAEKEKKATILKAEGEQEAQALSADSERIRIEKRAEAMYKVISDLKTILVDTSDEQLMQFLTSNAYIESMKSLSQSENSKFVLYPSDVQQPIDKVMNAEYLSQSMKKK